MVTSTDLKRDDRGAIMLIALCFAVFAVAILYLAIGAAEAVLFREHLQDAADSAALSGAIANARIMNVLVLINMVMVALLAILVTLKLIEGVAIVGMAIAAGLSWCTFGASLAAIPPLSALKTTVSSIYGQVKPLVFNALELLHSSGDAISDGAYYISAGMATGDIIGKDDGIDAKGFGASTARSLPVTDDSYDGLCGKAGDLSWHIANIPLSVIPGWGVIEDALDGPIASITQSLSDWFCGDGGGGSPDLSQDVDRGYPETEVAAQCRDPNSNGTSYTDGQEKDATSAACDAAAAERKAAEPDSQGNCVGGCDPATFDRVTSAARAACDPERKPTPTGFRYQAQEGKVEYKWDGAKWVRGEPVFRTSYANLDPNQQASGLPCNSPFRVGLLVGPDMTPCGQLTMAGYYPGYENKAHPDEEPARFQPACTSECAPQEPPPKFEKNPTRIVDFKQITHVFSCVRHERQPVDVSLDKVSPNGEGKKDGNKKSPKKLIAKTKMGREEFQIRAVVVADAAQQESGKLVRLSLWGRPDPSNPIEQLRKFGGVSYAQAEYYYDGDPKTEDPMWTMKWRGRLKGFHLPKADEAKSNLRESCDYWGQIDCGRLLGLAEEWKDLLLH